MSIRKYCTNKAKANQKKIMKNLFKFYKVKDYEEFINSYSIANYEEIKKNNFYFNVINNMPSAYVRTSGTNSYSKLIPISEIYLKKNHIKASKMILFDLLFRLKQFHILQGNNLVLNGYLYEELYKGKKVIDISALLLEKRPKLFERISFPTVNFSTWNEKLDFLLKDIDRLKKITSISGVPTWMISFFLHVKKHTNREINEILPNLRLIIHGGVNFDNYYSEFKSIFYDRKLTFYNVYNATEGFFGIQCASDGILRILDNVDVFYEFKNGKEVIPLWEVEKDVEYELLITNRDGLVRYRTSDLIKFISLSPLLFRIIGRSSEFINAFGEDVLINQIDAILKKALSYFDFNIIDFFIVPYYSNKVEVGYHEWYFVIKEKISKTLITQIEFFLDKELQMVNNNYHQKRNLSLAMQNLKIKQIDFNFYTEIINAYKQKQGGQIKLKKLYNNREIIKYINYEKRFVN